MTIATRNQIRLIRNMMAARETTDEEYDKWLMAQATIADGVSIDDYCHNLGLSYNAIDTNGRYLLISNGLVWSVEGNCFMCNRFDAKGKKFVDLVGKNGEITKFVV